MAIVEHHLWKPCLMLDKKKTIYHVIILFNNFENCRDLRNKTL